MPSPLLLVDIGNTRLKWAEVTSRGAIRLRGHVPTALATSEWMAAWAKTQEGRRIIVASVVPEKSRLLRRHVKQALFVSGALRGLPLAFDYPRPSEIGADRIAAAIGALGGTRLSGPVIVVSCGTATAFSVLDRKGRFCGGVIAPGAETQLRALVGATAQLPVTTLRPTARSLGRSTQAAMRAGVLLQFQGGVRETIGRLRREIGGSARVIVIGGQARHLQTMRGLGRVEFRPLLVFEGLRIIAASIPES
jgi:type III pantothenate kinase